MTKIVFETDKLTAALRDVRGAVQRRNTIPILSNVLIESDAVGEVRLTTTDLEVMAVRTLPGEVGVAAAFTVDANRLTDVVGTFATGSQTTIAFEGRAVVVSSGRARTRFSTLPREDFPILLQTSVDTKFVMEAKALSRGIGAVRHAVSTEETRYYLNGILLHEREGRIAYVATDGHRLARYVDDLPNGAAGLNASIVPTRAIDLIRAAADTRDSTVEISVGNSKVTFAVGDFTLVSKLIDGTFPDYTRVIPTGQTSTLKVDRDALAEAVARVTAAVSDKVRAVKLSLDRDIVRASTTSPEHGDAVDEVPCDYSAGTMEIGFNGRYLRDALQVLDVDIVEIGLIDSRAPTLIGSPEASGVTLVLMPTLV